MTLPCHPFRREVHDAGDIFPTLVTPDDAKRYIAEVDTGYERLNAAILSSGAQDDFKVTWGVQFAGWKTFSAGAMATVGWLNTKAVMDQTDRWGAQLMTWRDAFVKLGGKAPAFTPPGQGTGTGLNLGDLTNLLIAAGALLTVAIVGKEMLK